MSRSNRNRLAGEYPPLQDGPQDLLTRLGIIDPAYRAAIVDELPCGIETPEEAWGDGTSVAVNAPRALMIVHWKGVVRGFALRSALDHRPTEPGPMRDGEPGQTRG